MNADNKQMEISEQISDCNNVLKGDDLDKALYDCMNTIWKAYRDGVKDFNDCFNKLYNKYSDPAVERFIQGMGMGLVVAVNRRGKK